MVYSKARHISQNIFFTNHQTQLSSSWGSDFLWIFIHALITLKQISIHCRNLIAAKTVQNMWILERIESSTLRLKLLGNILQTPSLFSMYLFYLPLWTQLRHLHLYCCLMDKIQSIVSILLLHWTLAKTQPWKYTYLQSEHMNHFQTCICIQNDTYAKTITIDTSSLHEGNVWKVVNPVMIWQTVCIAWMTAWWSLHLNHEPLQTYKC